MEEEVMEEEVMEEEEEEESDLELLQWDQGSGLRLHPLHPGWSLTPDT